VCESLAQGTATHTTPWGAPERKHPEPFGRRAKRNQSVAVTVAVPRALPRPAVTVAVPRRAPAVPRRAADRRVEFGAGMGPLGASEPRYCLGGGGSRAKGLARGSRTGEKLC
jgi:hypothetical protein